MVESAPRPRSMVLDEFIPLVSQPFTVDATPAEISIILVEAKPLKPNDYAERPPFLLIFSSAPDVMLVAGHYAMAAKGFGPDLIYIAQTNPPPGDKSGRHYYQAVFN